MTKDQGPPSNSLTDKACSATVLPIDVVLAQRLCLAVAQVLAAGYGEVQIVVADHGVKFIHTKLSEKF